MNRKISRIIPCFNEQEALGILDSKVKKVMG